eukprot:15689966-Heterocapsa_arctica.AAC.1
MSGLERRGAHGGCCLRGRYLPRSCLESDLFIIFAHSFDARQAVGVSGPGEMHPPDPVAFLNGGA